MKNSIVKNLQMTEEIKKEFSIVDLWYILPGMLILLPVILLQSGNQSWQQVSLIVIAFPVGFCIHRLYRLIYHYSFLYNRRAILHLQKIIKSRAGKNSINKKQTEYFYNQFIYCKTEYQEELSKIKKQSFFCTSIFTCALALYFSSSTAIFLYLSIQQEPLLLLYAILSFVGFIILLVDYFTLFDWLNSNEIMLINKIVHEKATNDFLFTSERIRLLITGLEEKNNRLL